MLTARLFTNCSITQRNILTPDRISQVPEREYHKDTCKREAGYFFVAHPVCRHKKEESTQSILSDYSISVTGLLSLRFGEYYSCSPERVYAYRLSGHQSTTGTRFPTFLFIWSVSTLYINSTGQQGFPSITEN
jgi:hypothetical protein